MEDFDELLIKVAKRVQQNSEIDTLGKKLEFPPEDVGRYIATNHKTQNITWDGTLQMLRDWRKGQEIAKERDNLETALKKAGQLRLAEELFPSNTMDLTGVRRKPNGDDPSSNTALSQNEFYDIYLWASSKDTDYFRKMKDCIHSNRWKMTSCFDHKLGELVTQSIENALLKCSHMVCLITKDDCKTDNLQQLMTIEMAIQSLPRTTGKGLEGRVIPIRCDVPESFLTPKLKALTGASIKDRDLEERLRKSINTNIRMEREEKENVTGCYVCQPERDVTRKRRYVKMSSGRPSTTKDDEQKQRELDEMRKKLNEKRAMLEETKQRHKVVESKIEAVSNSSSKHFQTIHGDIQETLDKTLLKLKVKERENIECINEINKDADKQITDINKKRQKRIEAKKVELERERKIIKDNEAKLSSCITDKDEIRKKVSEKISDVNSKIQDAITNIEFTITRINQHDETLVNEAPQVLASIDENLSLNVHQDVSVCLDRIQSEVERVKFVEGEVGGKYYGRIDGYISNWELVKSIHIPSVVNKPYVCGLVSDDEICVRDVGNNDMYITNINTQHTEKVIDGGVWITSCAPIDSNVIVCGKVRDDCTGDRLDGCITLYDRQLNVIRDISIPMNRYGYNSVYVDVDRDGMIIAAQYNQSNIYVINPADDKIVNTITMQGKTVRGGIQALSSGDIVVKTDYNEYTVVSRSGERKAVMHCDEYEWGWSSECLVDKLTDTLYIAYVDTVRNTIAIDQVSRDGIIQARRIVEYVKSDRTIFMGPCLVTPSGNLVGCDGDKLLIYKKTLIL
ncbi:uncharacterized protein LOC135154451 [Lytechinus pictus]|uniref:uncharacterized protein LOC135154451 n=1 Tax=Lytechinus pictus TaxID=7653 RepID=UPI0030BA19C0